MAAPGVPPSRQRGFTLIELMVVVMIIAIMATLAIPQASLRMRERRAQEAADRIAAMFRTARMRAMGRGAAVSVRFQDGAFGMYEAGQNTGSCVMPSSRCSGLPALDATALNTFNPTRGPYEDLSIDSAESALEVCFTPLGSAYSRTDLVDPPTNFEPLGQVLTLDVYRPKGLKRTVTLLPNGVARVTARAP